MDADKAPSGDPTPQDYLGHPTSLIGCACGKYHVPSRTGTFEVDGVVHRHGLACYRAGESRQLGALPEALDELKRLRSRVAFLEAALAAGHGATTTAWGAALEPIETPAGQDPEAGGHT